MNLAALFALLLQTGACAPVTFNSALGDLTVIVCPMLKPARPSAPADPEDDGKPKVPT